MISRNAKHSLTSINRQNQQKPQVYQKENKPMPTQESWASWNRTVYAHYRAHADFKPERRSWHEREAGRQADRPLLGWCEQPFWRDSHNIYKYHFPHGATGNPALIAYTVDDEKGERDIQTPIKPGRYLRQFFSDVLTEKQIAYYADMHTKHKPQALIWADLPVKFATTEQDIVDVYARGPVSCMSGDGFAAIKPARVYAAGDLAIAYMEASEPLSERRAPTHTIVARTLCWPEKKVVGRVYPTPDGWEQDGFESWHAATSCQSTLLRKLQDEGYTSVLDGSATFAGAKLLRVQKLTHAHRSLRDCFVMPYLDNRYRIGPHPEEPEKFFVIAAYNDSRDTFGAQSTCGFVECPRPKAHTCRNCGIGYDEAPTAVVTNVVRRATTTSEWCPTCARNYAFTCALSGDLCTNEVHDKTDWTIRRGHTKAQIDKWRAEKDAREARERAETEALRAAEMQRIVEATSAARLRVEQRAAQAVDAALGGQLPTSINPAQEQNRLLRGTPTGRVSSITRRAQNPAWAPDTTSYRAGEPSNLTAIQQATVNQQTTRIWTMPAPTVSSYMQEFIRDISLEAPTPQNPEEEGNQ